MKSSEIAAFWDDFAEEYEEIQQESATRLPEALAHFLLEQQLLPATSFLDLAGGTGRYLPALSAHVASYTLVDISEKMLQIAREKIDPTSSVTFLQLDQRDFFQTKKTYDLVFSAMNPALQTEADLHHFTALSNGWCLILRMKKEVDTLFSPFEKAHEDALNPRYKRFLAAANIPFFTKEFHFETTEWVTKDFFKAYFHMDCSAEALEQRTDSLFQQQDQVKNHRQLVFELLYYHV